MKKIIILITSIFLLMGITVTTALVITYNKLNDSSNNITTDNTVTDIEYSNLSNINIADSDSITVKDGEDIKITKEGSYTISGSSSDTSIIVDTEGEVTLILDNVNIINNDGAVIYVENVDKVYIVLNDDTDNTLTDSINYNNYGEEDVDAVIYSKDDLVISGSGSLTINANNNHGIHSKDYIQILSGTINITCKNDGIVGKDYVAIKEGNITINSDSDGIKASNETDSSLGYIVIDGGSITIKSEGDAINAQTKLNINGGTFNITTGGESSNSTNTKNSWWGNTSSSTDDESSKGFKADKAIVITGGTINIDSKDDGIHSNGDITISGGEFTINSGDDAIHADGMIEINKGTITIKAAEGIEATYVKINDGTIKITATDDGIIAGNKSNAYSTKVEINGGNIVINMGQGDTDGIDSNGDIIINGGTVNVTGQSTFDYDGKGEINGGTVIVNGSEVSTLPNQFMGGAPGGVRR